MQGVFYWGMKISRKEVDLLSLNDYSYLHGYIFGEIIESIYPGEEPVDIFRADQSCPHTTQPVLKRSFYGHNTGENLNEKHNYPLS